MAPVNNTMPNSLSVNRSTRLPPAKGVITLPVLIYTRGIVTFDLPGAAVIATVQIALSLVLYGLYRLVFARLMSGRGKGDTDVVVEQAK